MVEKVIHIDETKCDGCGLCAEACHEGAICILNGKAKLLREDACDGMGDCLPTCPRAAISFVERDTAKLKSMATSTGKTPPKIISVADLFANCPENCTGMCERNGGPQVEGGAIKQRSQLAQWPCQIRLAPEHATYFDGAKLLIVADCAAYAYADFHKDFMRGKITLIGCPKFDATKCAEKLDAIIANNNIQSVTVARMEVPCCGGLERIAAAALEKSGKEMPWRVAVISTKGLLAG